MDNYQQQAVTGTTWQRARQIILDNPYGGLPRVSFIEEIRTELSNGMARNEIAPGTLAIEYQPGYAFPMIDPQTNEPLGFEATSDQLLAMVYSLYMKLAADRDAPTAP